MNNQNYEHPNYQSESTDQSETNQAATSYKHVRGIGYAGTVESVTIEVHETSPARANLPA